MNNFVRFSLFVLLLRIGRSTSATAGAGAHTTDQQKQVVLEHDPIVNITNGPAIGGVKYSRDGIMYFEFLGIPFGKVEKRFEDAKPSEPWEQPRDFKQPGPICLQRTFHTQEVVGQEDCLNLNVYTTSLPSSASAEMAVMVFIHGGGFQSGSGIMYTPNFLIEQNVVVVTVNYRLGPFGWFNLGTKEAAGNQGGKDTVFALKWIRDNIQVFNGDKNRVTIFGQSAGGGVVTGLLLSPMAQGLFHNVIIQSGSGRAPGFFNKRPKHYAMQIATKLNCTSSSSEAPQEVVDCLQNKDRLDVLDALNQLNGDWDNEDMHAEFAFDLSAEDEIDDAEAFLPKSPRKLLAEGNFDKVPVMLGVTEKETLYMIYGVLFDEKKLTALNTEWNRVAPMWFQYYGYGQATSEYNLENTVARDELSGQVKELYFKDVEFKNDDATAIRTEKASSDVSFNAPTRHLALLLAQKYVPTYLYMFNKKMNGSQAAPSHSEELNYLFSISPPDGLDPPIGVDSPDYDFSKHMTRLWASFAKNGFPSHAWGNATEEWRPIAPLTTERFTWYTINDDSIKAQVESAQFIERMEFWATAWDDDENGESGAQLHQFRLFSTTNLLFILAFFLIRGRF